MTNNTGKAILTRTTPGRMTYDIDQPNLFGNDFKLGFGWHQIVVTFAKGSYSCYINGERAYVGSVPDISRFLLKAEGLLFFTDNNANNDNDVEVSEIAIWDLDLTEEEIHQFSGLNKLDRQNW